MFFSEGITPAVVIGYRVMWQFNQQQAPELWSVFIFLRGIGTLGQRKVLAVCQRDIEGCHKVGMPVLLIDSNRILAVGR